MHEAVMVMVDASEMWLYARTPQGTKQSWPKKKDTCTSGTRAVWGGATQGPSESQMIVPQALDTEYIASEAGTSSMAFSLGLV